MVGIAINGMGRIGRLIARRYIQAPPEGIELVAVNDIDSAENIAYLMKYDSVHGRADFDISSSENKLNLCGNEVTVTNVPDPSKLPWKDLGVDIVLECTGLFRDHEKAAGHLEAGASKVIISAPSDNADISIVLGVNEDKYDPSKHDIISATSCTTNSLAVVAKVLNDSFGIDNMMATTVHAYTASQKLVDTSARKRVRGRAAAVSLIPTSTGAAKATALVIPELSGRMFATAIRAPIPDGAITDITAFLNHDVTEASVNEALKAASVGKMNGILDFSEDELVSADILTDPHSSVVDAHCTKVINNRVVKVMAWYDNEYGFSCRMVDLASFLARSGGLVGRGTIETPIRA